MAPQLTTRSGSPMAQPLHSMTAGPRGPMLLQDTHYIETIAAFDRERVPERVVHAKGSGAHGFFEVTNPGMSQWTKAAFLQRAGLRTPTFVRFSTVGGESGSADSERDPRGFAVKHYTSEGNYDMVGNNTPVFFINDPMLFPSFIHTQKRDPKSNLKSATMHWDFAGQRPETTHMMTYLFGDRGIPAGYHQMNGYSSHTFVLVNAQGERFYCKQHYKVNGGFKTMLASVAEKLAGSDPDSSQRALFGLIDGGGEAEWKVSYQICPEAEALAYKVDWLDVTKVVPHSDYPLIEVGRLVLNRNPENYFAEVEQVAYSPSNLVPGIETSNDKLLQGRLFSYPDTHRHRVGPNHKLLPINRPLCPMHSYTRAGPMRMDGNGGASPNYFPNSDPNAPQPAASTFLESTPAVSGNLGRTPLPAKPVDDWVQAGDLYRRVMSPAARTRLVENMSGHMNGVTGPRRTAILTKAIANFYKADREFGSRLAKNVGISTARL